MPPAERCLPMALAKCRVGLLLGGVSNNGMMALPSRELFPPTDGEERIN